MSDKAILIVEDNPLSMKLLTDLMQVHGHRTIVTTDGMTALTLARLHRPDLILLDVQLPFVSGIEIVKWLKDGKETRHIPVIAVTAFAMKGDEDRIRRAGFDDYVAKPISVPAFMAKVNSYLSAAPVIA